MNDTLVSLDRKKESLLNQIKGTESYTCRNTGITYGDFVVL